MEDDSKLPLKRVEISLTKFNEVAIPHHLELLRQHKANILKYEAGGEYRRVCTEQRHARRVASQLRSLLAELEALRAQVQPDDRKRFDILTKRARDDTLAAIIDYLDTTPLSINRCNNENVAGSAVSTDSVGVVAHHLQPHQDLQPLTAVQPFDTDIDLIQLQVDDQEAELAAREAVLRGWSELQQELHALCDAWRHVNEAALQQREQVNAVSEATQVAAENVEVARHQLALAHRMRAGAVGAGGAVVGALVGGPVGAVVGAKAGAVAALAGSVLGYLAASALRRRQGRVEDRVAEPPVREKDD